MNRMTNKLKKNATKDLKNLIYTELLISHKGFTNIANWTDGYALFPIPENAEIIEKRSEVIQIVNNLNDNSLFSKKNIITKFEIDLEKSRRFIIYTGTLADLEMVRNHKCHLTINNIKIYITYLMGLDKFDKVVQFSQKFSVQNIIESFSITNQYLSNQILDTIKNPIEITETFPFAN